MLKVVILCIVLLMIHFDRVVEVVEAEVVVVMVVVVLVIEVLELIVVEVMLQTVE